MGRRRDVKKVMARDIKAGDRLVRRDDVMGWVGLVEVEVTRVVPGWKDDVVRIWGREVDAWGRRRGVVQLSPKGDDYVTIRGKW